jgi:hypothetical protein
MLELEYVPFFLEMRTQLMSLKASSHEEAVFADPVISAIDTVVGATLASVASPLLATPAHQINCVIVWIREFAQAGGDQRRCIQYTTQPMRPPRPLAYQ